jgi:hypothetical protein
MSELSREQIAQILNEATGAPTSGPVAELLPVLVDALDAALNPVPATTKRVLKVDETR